MRNKFFYIAIIFLIPLALTFIWFRSGDILGHGESGLPFYNPALELNIFRYAWSNYVLGLPTNVNVASFPFYWLLSKFQEIGMPGFVSQAFFFWIVFAVSGVGIYLFTSELFPRLKSKFLLLAVFFYWFNPFSLVNVWNRFLNTFMVFYGLLPLALYLFIHGITTKKYIYAILTALLTALLSYAFTAVAFDILFWALLFFTTTFYVFASGEWKERIYIIRFFLLTFVLFLMVNFWWISQLFTNQFYGNFATVVSDFLSRTGNYQTLTILSQQLGSLMNLIRLRHATFFGTNGLFWLQIYNFSLIQLLEFVVFGVILFASIKNRRSANALFLAILLIITLFLAKGSNPPFGEIFEYFFLKFTALQAFRNPFEKIMFIAPLAFSPLFVLGVSDLADKISSQKRMIVYVVSVLWVLVMWGYPFWTGLVFSSGDVNSVSSSGFEVRVPEYYKQAAGWLNSQQGNFRLLVLPIGEEGITYSWEKGYSGIELTNHLLPVPSVSFNTTIPYYNNLVSDLNSYLSSGQDITQVMNLLNAKYIMFRSDIEWRSRGMQDPQDILNKLTQSENDGLIKKVADFGQISFWENLKWENKEIFSATRDVSILPTAKISDVTFAKTPGSIFSSTLNFNDASIIVHPESGFTLNRRNEPIYEIRQDIFPSVKFLPSNFFYRISLLKENLEAFLIKDKYALVLERVAMLGKRLVEAQTEADKQNSKGVITALKGYQNLLPITAGLLTEVNRDLFKQTQVYMQEGLYDIFSDHQAVLSSIDSKFPSDISVKNTINDTEKLLANTEINLNISPTSGYVGNKDFPIDKRILYKFNLTKSGEYQLFWGDESLYKYYQFSGNHVSLQVNSKTIDSTITQSGDGRISLGKLDLSGGINEIGLNTPKQINLVDAPQELDMKVDHGDQASSFPIKNLDPKGTYYVSFDYLIERGSALNVSVVTDSDNSLEVIDKGGVQRWIELIKKTFYYLIGKKVQVNSEQIPSFSKTIFTDFENLNFSERNASYYFTVNAGAKTANLVFDIKPWNNCEQIFASIFTKSRCNNTSFKSKYDKTTLVHIKNISLVRVLTDEPVLVQENPKVSPVSAPNIDFTKRGNSDYLVNIRGANGPFVLTLSELYDSGWKVFDGKTEILQKSHFVSNIYANGWLVDKKGDFSLEIKYVPQDLLSKSELFSGGAIVLALIVIIWHILRKIKK